jgi:hypothetical protein
MGKRERQSQESMRERERAAVWKKRREKKNAGSGKLRPVGIYGSDRRSSVVQ